MAIYFAHLGQEIIFMKTLHNKLSAIIFVALSFFITLSASALTVSPAKMELAGDPGSFLEGEVVVYNEKDSTQTFYTSFENFEPSGDSGRPQFVGADDGLATWMTVQESVTLSPKERIKVPFSLKIPVDADAGGYFSAMFFGTEAPNAEAGKVSIGGRLGILALLRVNGDIPEQGGLLEYGAKSGDYFYANTPIDFEYRFNNQGGDYVTPKGDIKITNTFGSLRDTIDANPQEGSVLPGSARRFDVVYGEDMGLQGFFATAKSQLKKFRLGFYKAEINLGWGYTNQTAKESISFFMFPWQLLLLIILIATVLYFILRFAARKYKLFLINQIQNQTKES